MNLKKLALFVNIARANCDFNQHNNKTPNECNPAKTCNVCPQCCKAYILDGPTCDNCTKAECHGPSPSPSPIPGPHLADEQKLLCDLFQGSQAGDGWLSACKEGWSDMCTLPNANYCGAHGISCDQRGHVTDINLGGCNVRGKIAVNTTGSSIFSLPALETVLLYNGQGAKCDETPGSGISGVLPDDLSEATNLRVIGLYCNAFEGDLHALEKLPRLQTVDLHYNKFSGALPKLSQSKASLSYISLANNNFGGPMPSDWTELVHLGTLGLANNKLDGEVLTMLTPENFPNMTVLFLRHNKFTGRIGPRFPPSLEVVDLDHNSFTGVDPAVCDYQLPSAFKNQGGCGSDWPNQGLGTCCVANQATASGSEWCLDVGQAPQCLSNCQPPRCGATVKWEYRAFANETAYDATKPPFVNYTSGTLRLLQNSSEMIIDRMVLPGDQSGRWYGFDMAFNCSVTADGSLLVEARSQGDNCHNFSPVAQAVRAGCSFVGMNDASYDDVVGDFNVSVRCCFADE